jgi:hypothetical protein
MRRECGANEVQQNIYFTGGTCSGGHGLSIGSVGGRDDNTVKNVTITDSTVTDSANGVRIKTVYDATGSISDVTFSDITISGITDYGIVIEQDYENGSPTGTPTSGVPITDLTVKGITGSVESDAVEVYICISSVVKMPAATGPGAAWTSPVERPAASARMSPLARRAKQETRAIARNTTCCADFLAQFSFRYLIGSKLGQ